MPARSLTVHFPMLTLLIGLACLAGCGGEPAFPSPGKVTFPPGSPVVMPPASPTEMPQRPALLAGTVAAMHTTVPGTVAGVVLESTGSAEQRTVPVTFGHAFKLGDVGAQHTLGAKLANGADVPLQVDVKTRHPDGSVRHAVLSALAPSLAPGASQALALIKSGAAPGAQPTAPAATPAALLAAGFSSTARVTLGGVVYSASADALLASGHYRTWLAGPVVNEWHVAAPLRNAEGVAHPHLTARFAIRAYSGVNRARVDITLENNWAYEPLPQNLLYDVALTVGPQTVYSKTGMTHYHHARWRKLFWWGEAPQIHVRHDTAYLIATRAVPNYDRTIAFPETTLAAMKTTWTGAKTEPMGVGLANPYMPSTGGRTDIGLLPGWAATYLLTMDRRAKEVTLGTADLAGSWSSHYRDQNTDRPVSLVQFPYMTILGHYGDTFNPVTKQREAFPPCASAAACTTANTHDASHQPNFAYLPYLVTGDYYYLEELQFWAMWNSFMSNPGFRESGKGLLKAEQVRGQAWGLRSLAEAAYITPDADPLKGHFEHFVNSNLDWYNAEYPNNARANALGILINGYAIVYNAGTGIAPWQDDFFTSAVGRAVELGFEKATPLLAYKSKFPIARMTTPGACWIDGAIYTLTVRDSATAPLYPTLEQAYLASHTAAFNALTCAGADMAGALKLKVGEMTGYSASMAGYPSNMQPALAYSTAVSGLDGESAWRIFMGRSVRPDYAAGPQFAIVPR